MSRRIAWRRLSCVALAAAFLAGAAGPRNASAEGRFGVAFLTGYHTYAQSDLNDELIAPINVLLLGTGYSMNDVAHGIGFGGGLRYRTEGPLVAAMDYERLTGKSTLDVPGGQFEANAAADAYTATVTYYFPSTSRARFGLGAGLGVYVAAGKLRAYDSTTMQEETEDMEGTGLGLHGIGAAEITLSNVAHLEACVGYRYAKSSDLKVGGQTALNADGSKSKLDWSGLMTRIGFSFYFGGK
ncbi:MAG: hypothetical protein ACM3JJ_01800 [Hyphomicrobiales bacterium]